MEARTRKPARRRAPRSRSGNRQARRDVRVEPPSERRQVAIRHDVHSRSPARRRHILTEHVIGNATLQERYHHAPPGVKVVASSEINGTSSRRVAAGRQKVSPSGVHVQRPGWRQPIPQDDPLALHMPVRRAPATWQRRDDIRFRANAEQETGRVGPRRFCLGRECRGNGAANEGKAGEPH